MEIRPVGSALVRTDKIKLIGSVRDYANPLKIFLCVLLQLHFPTFRKFKELERTIDFKCFNVGKKNC